MRQLGCPLLIWSAGLLCQPASAEAGAAASEATQRCERILKSAPAKEQMAHCLIRLGKDPTLYDYAVGRVLALRRKDPTSHNLTLALGHLLIKQNPDLARRIMDDARLHFRLQGNDDGLVRADLGLYALARRTGDRKAQTRQVQRLETSSRTARHRKSRLRATVAWAHHMIVRESQIGEAWERVLQAWRGPTFDLPLSIRGPLHRVRAFALVHYRRYSKAKHEYEEMGAIAQQSYDPELMVASHYGRGLAYLFELENQPSEKLRTQAEVSLRAGLVLAERYGQDAFRIRAIRNLAWLLSGDPSRRAVARSLADDALTYSEGQGHQATLTISHALQSQVRLAEHPLQAMEYATLALSELEDQEYPLGQIFTWRQLARAAWHTWPSKSAKWITLAMLELLESQRSAQVKKRARRELFATRTPDYDWAVGQLLQEGDKDDLALAFSLMERAKARGLLDRWFTSKVQPSQKMPTLPPRFRVCSPGSLSKLADSSWMDALRTWVLKRMRARGDLDISELQQALKPDQAMLAYHLVSSNSVDGEPLGSSYALLVTRRGLEALPLALRPEQLRSSTALYRSATFSRAKSMASISQTLYEQAVAPILDRLPSDIKDIVLVTDDPLHGLSFNGMDPSHRWSRVPSAQAWLALKRRNIKARAPKGLVVVDPKLSSRRLRTLTRAHPFASIRRAHVVGSRLPYSQKEAHSILGHLGRRRFKVLVGQEASRQELLRAWTPDLNFLHISAHTRYHDDSPELTSIALAPSDDGLGSAWTFSQIEAQNFYGATIVLGGCATGHGPTTPGEGVLSLTSAFLGAGAHAVLSSLWPVRDKEAARFFAHFYQMWGQGQTLLQALHGTQAYFREQGEDPAMYSGYVLTGDGNVQADSR